MHREELWKGCAIAASFQNALTVAGVEQVAALGERFDPELHQVVDTR